MLYNNEYSLVTQSSIVIFKFERTFGVELDGQLGARMSESEFVCMQQ